MEDFTEMEKFVSKAIKAEAVKYAHHVWAEKGWQETVEGDRHYLRMARAAIRAMGDPTAQIIHAACDEVNREQVRPVSINRVDVANIWSAMVGAASKP